MSSCFLILKPLISNRMSPVNIIHNINLFSFSCTNLIHIYSWTCTLGSELKHWYLKWHGYVKVIPNSQLYIIFKYFTLAI
jgi:hypothetical protein